MKCGQNSLRIPSLQEIEVPRTASEDQYQKLDLEKQLSASQTSGYGEEDYDDEEEEDEIEEGPVDGLANVSSSNVSCAIVTDNVSQDVPSEKTQGQGQGRPTASKNKRQKSQGNAIINFAQANIDPKESESNMKRNQLAGRLRETLDSFKLVIQQGAQPDKTARSRASSSLFEVPNQSDQADDIVAQFDQLVQIKKSLSDIKKKREEAKQAPSSLRKQVQQEQSFEMQEMELEARLAAGKELIVQFMQEHILDVASHRYESVSERHLSRTVPVQMLKDLNSG